MLFGFDGDDADLRILLVPLVRHVIEDEPEFARLASERGLSWEDRDGFRLDYAETLKRWRDRYNAAVSTGALDGFTEVFHDLWRYYLMYCEGGFRGGAIDVAQVTLTKDTSS